MARRSLWIGPGVARALILVIVAPGLVSVGLGGVRTRDLVQLVTAGATTPAPAIDFNGDGYADLATEVLDENVNGVANAGAVEVLYGSAHGIQADGPDDQFWTQDSPGVLEKPDPYDQFGWSLAGGDFNGDGFSDLAIGVPREDIRVGSATVQNAGALNVLYGSAAGLTAGGNQLWTQESAGVPNQADAEDGFGRAVASADFNADGYADLAIDTRREDVGTAADAGAVTVLFGSAAGLQASDPTPQEWTQDSAGVPDGAEAGDWFGRALAAGDVNGDGWADLVVGIPLENLAAGPNAGGVNVLYGSSTGLQTVSPAAQFWTQDSPDVLDRAEAGDYVGRALAIADFNGDGFGDLAISSRLEDVLGAANAGGFNVLYGSPAGLQAVSPPNQFWTQASPGVQDDPEPRDHLSYSVAGGDFNADGWSDLAIGIEQEQAGGKTEAGAVAVLYGSGAGLQADSPDDQLWTQASPGVKDDAERKDLFGYDVAVDDFDGNGVPDLAVGVPREDGVATDTGAVEILYAVAGTGVQADAPDDQIWDQDSPGVQDSGRTGDEIGFRVV